jgi:hypothetical protein
MYVKREVLVNKTIFVPCSFFDNGVTYEILLTWYWIIPSSFPITIHRFDSLKSSQSHFAKQYEYFIIQGEYKVFPWLQTISTKNYVEYKHIFFLPLLKLLSWVLLQLSYIKKYVCIPRSFLVINVCNQGKTLCSPCTSCLTYTCWFLTHVALLDESRLRNHFCHGKTIGLEIKHYMSMYVYSCIFLCAVLYYHLWPLWLHRTFSNHLTNSTIFRKKSNRR